MPDKKQDDSSFGVAVFAVLVACFALGVSLCAIAFQAKPTEPCKCKPAPTPAACCKSDGCRKELAQVDARFGDVWDELVEVQEQLAKVNSELDAQVDAFLRHRHQDSGEARPGPACSPMPKCHADCRCTSAILPDGKRTTYKNGCACKCDLCRCSEPACSDKPACECKPAEKPQPKVFLPTYRKRCR